MTCPYFLVLAMSARTSIQCIDTPFDMTLWLVALGDKLTAEDLSVLSSYEHERAASFYHAKEARRFQASHVALRYVLSQATGMDPAKLVFEHNQHGKPRLADRGLHFSMSQAQDWALIGVALDRPVGVDIEWRICLRDAARLAQCNLTSTEQMAFAHCMSDQRNEGFLRGWTRKGACLKAIGSGLSIAPHAVETGITPAITDTVITVNGQTFDLTVTSLELPISAIGAVAMMDANSPWRSTLL